MTPPENHIRPNLPPSEPGDDPLLAALQARLAREDRGLARLRAWPTRWRLSALAGGALGLFAAFAAAFGVATGLRSREDPVLFWGALGLSGAASAGSLAWLFRGPLSPGVGAVTSRSRALMAVVGCLAPFGLAAALAGGPGTLLPAAEDLVTGTVGCYTGGLLLALPLFALAVLLDRGEPGRATRLALAGTFAGLVAFSFLHVHCPNGHMGHLVFGHADLPLTLALVALAVAAYNTRRTAL